MNTVDVTFNHDEVMGDGLTLWVAHRGKQAVHQLSDPEQAQAVLNDKQAFMHCCFRLHDVLLGELARESVDG